MKWPGISLAQSIGAFANRGGGLEVLLHFMVARFVRKCHECHEVMMDCSEWLLLEIHTDSEPFCKINFKPGH